MDQAIETYENIQVYIVHPMVLCGVGIFSNKTVKVVWKNSKLNQINHFKFQIQPNYTEKIRFYLVYIII